MENKDIVLIIIVIIVVYLLYEMNKLNESFTVTSSLLIIHQRLQ